MGWLGCLHSVTQSEATERESSSHDEGNRETKVNIGSFRTLGRADRGEKDMYRLGRLIVWERRRDWLMVGSTIVACTCDYRE